MNMLVKGNQIYEIAEKIMFGTYDGEEKWRIADTEDNTQFYVIDDGFTLIENIEVPSDYVDGKYFFENGEFVLNAEWKPYVSPEERIAQLEETVALQEEMLMMSDEAVVLLYELQSTQSEINDAQDEAIIGLYEIMLS